MTNLPNTEPKRALRREIKQTLSSVSSTAMHAHSADIVSHLTEFITTLDDIQHIASFAATPLEPDLHTLHHTLHGVSLSYPKCAADGIMQFHQVNRYSSLTEGSYKILEPDPETHPEVGPGDIDIFLCPAYAYSRNGERLGKGGGFYDRYLAKRKTSTIVIGVAFELQLVDRVPTDKHDIPVDFIVTENGLIRR